MDPAPQFQRSQGRLSLAWRDLSEIPPSIVKRFSPRLTASAQNNLNNHASQARIVRQLDLTNNRFESGRKAVPSCWANSIEVLVLDGNLISEDSLWPDENMSKLRVLWVNRCQIGLVGPFLDNLLPHIVSEAEESKSSPPVTVSDDDDIDNTDDTEGLAAANGKKHTSRSFGDLCCPLRELSLLQNPACPNFFNGKRAADNKSYRLFVVSRIPGLTMLDGTPVTEEERSDALTRRLDLQEEQDELVAARAIAMQSAERERLQAAKHKTIVRSSPEGNYPLNTGARTPSQSSLTPTSTISSVRRTHGSNRGSKSRRRPTAASASPFKDILPDIPVAEEAAPRLPPSLLDELPNVGSVTQNRPPSKSGRSGTTAISNNLAFSVEDLPDIEAPIAPCLAPSFDADSDDSDWDN